MAQSRRNILSKGADVQDYGMSEKAEQPRECGEPGRSSGGVREGAMEGWSVTTKVLYSADTEASMSGAGKDFAPSQTRWENSASPTTHPQPSWSRAVVPLVWPKGSPLRSALPQNALGLEQFFLGPGQPLELLMTRMQPRPVKSEWIRAILTHVNI